MRPVWWFNNNDDTDATILLSEEDGRGYIYTGCEVDRRDSACAYFRKIDALNGELIWEAAFKGRKKHIGKKSFDGGFYASPLLGSGNCSDMIFSNYVKNLNGSNGDFVAINRHNGEIIYSIPLKQYAWSSPVAFLNEKDEMFILTADTCGYVYIINGINGEIILKFSYPLLNEVLRIVKEEEPKVVEQIFDNDCMVRLSMRLSRLPRLVERYEKLVIASRNDLRIEKPEQNG
jgi:hypothetical protein